jgi:uncharacterized protein YjbI with pentapeptide repeats
MRGNRIACTLIAVIAGGTACGETDPIQPTSPEADVSFSRTPIVCPALPMGTTGVVVSPQIATIGLGRSGDLMVTNQAGAPIADCQVKWSSSSTAIATVTASGLVTGIKAGGPVTIRATTNTRPTLVGAAAITISAATVTAVSVSPPSGALLVGGRLTLSASTSAGATPLANRIVRWTSLHPTIASVDSITGVVTGLSRGVTTIRATSEGVSGTASVSVDQVGSVTISPDSIRLVTGDQARVTATVRDLAGTVIVGAPVVWSQIADGVAVSSDGTVTVTSYQRPASGSIQATVGGVSASIVYRVGANLRGITMNGQNFRDENLSWADLTGATAVRTGFVRTSMVGATLNNTDFSMAVLRGTDFRTATISNVNFTRAVVDRTTQWPVGFNRNGRGLIGPELDMTGFDLRGVEAGGGAGRYIDLSDGNLTRAILEGVDFTGANFSRANFAGASLRGAGLAGANFTGAALNDADLSGAFYDAVTIWPTGFDFRNKLMYGPQTNLSGVTRSYLTLRYVQLRGANLSGATLIGTNFEYSDLREANLQNADLRETGLLFVDLTGADLTGANLLGAVYNPSTKWPAGVDPVARGARLVP